MPFYTIPGIGFVHMRGSGLPNPCIHCQNISSKLCDHVVNERTQATCDAPICEGCALHVPKKDLDYCKRHAPAHLAEVPAPLPFGEP
jgi:hypothetical protein